jgi:Zn-dependent peptidase ImmA (M78 family)/DNA-binding XRE family transcriptional regulator
MSKSGMMINPKRITEARQARAYNISQLASLIEVSRQAISRYEQGLSAPSPRIVEKMSETLNFPINFFYKDTIEFPSDSTVFYRSFKTSEADIRSMIKTRCFWASEVYECLNKNIVLPKLNLPALDLIIRQENISQETIENAAQSVRQYWGLGNGPIPNLTYELEKNGVIVSSSSLTYDKVEACSQVANGKPIILMSKGNKSACRIRFSLAHELGHIVMHGHITKEDIKIPEVLKRIETEANRFAGAFLLPEKSFVNDVNSVYLESFIPLKSKWKVSISSMIYRCNDLGILDEEQILSLKKQISNKRWWREEPLDKDIPQEKPKLLSSAINLLFKNNVITPLKFADRFSWNTEDLSDICNCAPSLFSHNLDIELQLK